MLAPDSAFSFIKPANFAPPKELMNDRRLRPDEHFTYVYMCLLHKDAIEYDKPRLYYDFQFMERLADLRRKTRQTLAMNLEMLRALRWLVKGPRQQDNNLKSMNTWYLYRLPASLDEAIQEDNTYLDFLVDQSEKFDQKNTRLSRLVRKLIVEKKNEFKACEAAMTHPRFAAHFELIQKLQVKAKLGYIPSPLTPKPRPKKIKPGTPARVEINNDEAFNSNGAKPSKKPLIIEGDFSVV